MDLEFERPIHFNREAAQAWADYYTKKSKYGAGIPGYRGEIYQRGEGIWDSILKFGLPIVKYLGPKIANTFLSASSEALEGENFLQSLKKAGQAEAKGIVSDLVGKTTSKLSGKGKRKRSATASRTTAKRRKKGQKGGFFSPGIEFGGRMLELFTKKQLIEKLQKLKQQEQQQE